MGKLKWVGLGLAALVAGLGIFVSTKRAASRPAPDLKVSATPELVARGSYLFNHQLACGDCHTPRDWSRYGGPANGKLGEGSTDCWDAKYDLPGTVCFPNLTNSDAGLATWTDGEISRAIREGVDKDGRGLFGMMPYADMAGLSDPDVEALIAYLRTLPASDQQVPVTKLDFPVSFFSKLAPKPLSGPVPEPNRSDPVALGKYLAETSGCRHCHSPIDSHHQLIEGRHYSGGQLFVGPWGKVRTANLTPDPKTGLKLSADDFVALFHSYRDTAMQREVGSGENTVMPWLSYSGLTEGDLRAIYAYLKTLPPLENAVVTRP